MTYIDEDNLMIITTAPMVGAVVKTPHNESIGEISGVILNTSTGDVPFVLLSLNDNNNKTKGQHIAISWEDFEGNTLHSQEYILDLKKIKWQDIPHFNSGYQPAYSQYELMGTVHTSQGRWPKPYQSYSNQ
jgi:hypothetical protein